MDRRDVIVFLAATCAGMRAARAQGGTLRRIGVVAIGPQPSPQAIEAAMAPGREFGWIERQNFEMVRRWGRRDEVDAAAAELVRQNVDVIIAPGAAAALAAKRATSSIPIVMVCEVDPVAIGLVSSLSRPGGNVTGVAELSDVTVPKRLELLRDLLPNARRVGVVVNTRGAASAASQVDEAAYAKLGMSPVAFNVGEPLELFDTMNDATRRGVQALVMAPPGLNINEIASRLMSVAIERKLPIISDDSDVVEAGGLASLGNDWTEQLRTLWHFVDRILRGAKPADLPVQQPSRFVIAINAKTAKALGVTVPSLVLQRANRVFD